MSGLLPLAILLVLMYAMLILPQQRRVKRQQALIASIEAGDDVLTTSGIFGTVLGFDEHDEGVMLVEVADGVVMRMSRGAVAEVAIEHEAETGDRELEPGDGEDT